METQQAIVGWNMHMKPLITGFALVTVTIGTEIAFCDDQSDNTGAQLEDIEEVVVTVRRRAEDPSKIPVSVSILDNESIHIHGITELNQLQKYVPNTVQTSFGQGSSSHATAFVRGIGQQDHIITTDPAVAIYLDGVYLGRNMGANMDLVNVEQVELVRGPQGTLSGRNTLGGALHVNTRQPMGEDFARLQMQIGTLGRLNSHFYGESSWSPAFSVSMSGGFKSRQGIGRALNIPHPEADVGQIGQAFGRLTAVWDMSENTTLTGNFDLTRSNQGVSPHEVTVFNPNNSYGLNQSDQPRNPDDTFSLNNELLSTENESSGISLTLEVTVNEAISSRVMISLREMWFEGGLDNEKVAATLIEFPERGEAEQTTIEIQFHGDAQWGDWVAGIFWFTEDGFNNSPFVFRSSGLGDGRPSYIPIVDFDGRLYIEQTTDAEALFGHANITLQQDWVLGIGARLTSDTKNALAHIHYFSGPVRRSKTWDDVTVDVSLTKYFQGLGTTYASYARGFQSGGYPARPFGGADTFKAYDPTFADSVEIGIKNIIYHNTIVNVAMFHVRYTDLAVQVSELVGDGFLTLTQNAAESTVWGVELDGNFAIGNHFEMTFAVGLLDAEISKVEDTVQGIRPGDKPALTPQYTVSLSPSINWIQFDHQITASLSYFRRGEMFGQPTNHPLNLMASLDLFSFQLSIQSSDRDSWNLSVYLSNAFNEVYPLARLDLDPTVLSINSNDRREFGVRLSKSFGTGG